MRKPISPAVALVLLFVLSGPVRTAAQQDTCITKCFFRPLHTAASPPDPTPTPAPRLRRPPSNQITSEPTADPTPPSHPTIPAPPAGDYPEGFACKQERVEILADWYYIKVHMRCTSTGFYGEDGELLYVTGIPPEANNGWDIAWFWWDKTLLDN